MESISNAYEESIIICKLEKPYVSVKEHKCKIKVIMETYIPKVCGSKWGFLGKR